MFRSLIRPAFAVILAVAGLSFIAAAPAAEMVHLGHAHALQLHGAHCEGGNCYGGHAHGGHAHGAPHHHIGTHYYQGYGGCRTCSNGDCQYRFYGQPDLFYNYYVPPTCGGVGAELYISPRPVPPHVGHTYITYQPLYPHEFLYHHHRTYHRYYNGGQGLTRTHVKYGTSIKPNWFW